MTFWHNVVCNVVYSSQDDQVKVTYSTSCGFNELYPHSIGNYKTVTGEENCTNPWFQDPKLSGMIHTLDGLDAAACTFHRLFKSEGAPTLAVKENLVFNTGFYYYTSAE